MVFLGETDPGKCVIKHTKHGIQVSGQKHAFLGYKIESSSGSNGIFVEWSIDNKNLKLSNDKFGFFPIYYFRDENTIAFSSSISDLLGMDSSHELDNAAIGVFLRTGSYIGNTTPFKKIRAVPPGATLRYEDRCIDLKNNKIKAGKRINISLSEAQRTYGELFQNSIEKFRNVTSKKIGLPLSGGRDSRHILLALLRSGVRPYSCLTMKYQPPKSNEDVKIASRVCSFVGVDHVVLKQPLSILNAEKIKNKITNFCSLDHSWILPLSQYLIKEKYDAIFDGIGGDVLSAGLFLTKQRLKLYQSEKFENLANDILGEEGYLPKMLTKQANLRFNRDLAIALLVDELKKYTNESNPVGQFFFWNRTRRNIAMSSLRILSKGCHVFAPYLDYELYKFLSSIPAEYFLDHKFHANSISNYYPEYSQLPYEKKNAPATKANHLINCMQLSEYLFYFLGSSIQKLMVKKSFLYPRIIKGILSPRYYNQTKYIYNTLIYLNQIAKP